jgi:hypothetical protein
MTMNAPHSGGSVATRRLRLTRSNDLFEVPADPEEAPDPLTILLTVLIASLAIAAGLLIALGATSR